MSRRHAAVFVVPLIIGLVALIVWSLTCARWTS